MKGIDCQVETTNIQENTPRQRITQYFNFPMKKRIPHKTAYSVHL